MGVKFRRQKGSILGEGTQRGGLFSRVVNWSHQASFWTASLARITTWSAWHSPAHDATSAAHPHITAKQKWILLAVRFENGLEGASTWLDECRLARRVRVILSLVLSAGRTLSPRIYSIEIEGWVVFGGQIRLCKGLISATLKWFTSIHLRSLYTYFIILCF